MECAEALSLRVQRLPLEGGASFQFGFHAKDNEVSLNDPESGNDVMGLSLLLRLDWRVFRLDTGHELGGCY